MCRPVIALIFILGWPSWISAEPPALMIKDLIGTNHTPWSDEKNKVVVLIFVSTDCPIANFYQPKLRRLAKQFADKGVSFYQIHPDPETSIEDAKQHVTDFEITVPVAIDHGQRLTRELRAKTTPEAFVLAPNGKTVYRGRIDDTYTKFGKRRPEPMKEDLKEAIDAVLAGNKVAIPVTESIGCLIFMEEVP